MFKSRLSAVMVFLIPAVAFLLAFLGSSLLGSDYAAYLVRSKVIFIGLELQFLLAFLFVFVHCVLPKRRHVALTLVCVSLTMGSAVLGLSMGSPPIVWTQEGQ